MANPSGFAGQLGYKTEASWGVGVTVDTFVPFSGEGLKLERATNDSVGIAAGRHTLRAWKPGARKVGGSLKFELPNNSVAALLKHMFGAVNTSGSNPYTHTYTPGDLTGDSLTIQIGKPHQGGVVEPFTYEGCKIREWELEADAGEIVQLNLDVTAKTEWTSRVVTDGATTNTSTTITSATAAFDAEGDVGKPISGAGIPAGATIASVTNATTAVLSAAATATASGVTFTIGPALAAASYPAGLTFFTFIEGALTIGGSALATVRKISLKGANSLADDRHRLGSAYVKEQLQAGMRAYTGLASLDFDGLTHYKRFVDASEVALVLAFAAGADTLTFTCNVRYDGESPAIGGQDDLLEQPVPFTCVHATSDASAITGVLVNTQSSAA